MNFPPPQWVKDAADTALNTTAANHYSHPKGRMRLREAIRDHYSKDFNRILDVEDEILVTSGANEGKSMHIALSAPHVTLQVNMPSGLRSSSPGTKSSFSSHTSTSIYPLSHSTMESQYTFLSIHQKSSPNRPLQMIGKLISTSYDGP